MPCKVEPASFEFIKLSEREIRPALIAVYGIVDGAELAEFQIRAVAFRGVEDHLVRAGDARLGEARLAAIAKRSCRNKPVLSLIEPGESKTFCERK